MSRATSHARALAKRFGLYTTLRRVSDQLKWSRSSERVRLMVDRSARHSRQLESALYGSLVPPGSLCFDVGANVGDKTSLYLELGCTVVALEPVSRNIDILHKRFKGCDRVTIVGAAVSDCVGTAEIHVVDENTAFSSLHPDWITSLQDEGSNRFGIAVHPPSTQVVATTTLEALMNVFGKPFFVKIDVEGHESSVLRGLSEAVPLVSFEANLPEFAEQTRECVALLTGLSAESEFNFVTEVPDRLQRSDWMRPPAFQSWLEATDVRFIEVFCRTTGPCPTGDAQPEMKSRDVQTLES